MENGYLVLRRKLGEAVRIDGGVTVVVHAIRGDNVYLAFDAPKDVSILREELLTREEPEPRKKTKACG